MKESLLVKHYAGSHSYGTALTDSDVDFRGIFCADPANIRTPFFPVREVVDSTEEDSKYYELAHFMKLCLDCNPNIVETLWVNDNDIVTSSDAYRLLRLHRQKLLSSKIAFTTSGYALVQLKRIKGHNKWINNPQPVEPPKPCDFVSVVQWFGQEKSLHLHIIDFNVNHRFVPYGGDIYGVYREYNHHLFDKTGKLNTVFEGNREDLDTLKLVLIVKWNKEEYKAAKERHRLYWTWKKNRNEKRSELEEQHGYDTKHAMHLVRLLRMGVEALRDGEIIVKRPDAEELLTIRDGAWKYDELVKYAEDMDKQVRERWYKKTELPKTPDIKFAAGLLMEVQDSVWSN